MTQNEMTTTEADVLDRIGSATAKRRWKRSGWPGMPITHLPMANKSELDSLVAKGLVELHRTPKNTFLVAL